MKVLPSLLGQLAPELETISPELLAEYLTVLGFETEVETGETPVLDVTITPNRGDGTSHLGLARDLRAFLARDSQTPPPTLSLEGGFRIHTLPDSSRPSIILQDDVASQYHAIILENVTIGPSPAWLQAIIKQLGLGTINNVVDLTNYLMEVYGQPLHAFDADSIKGEMVIRASKDGEALTTLDGTTHTLPEGVAVIADETGLIDLAGIRGGKNSEIRPGTKRVLLQSAIFHRSRIRKAVNSLQYRTTASTRYERGVDPFISLPVLEKAVEYLESDEFGRAKTAGKLLPIMGVHDAAIIRADPKKISQLLGFNVSKERLLHLLGLLGCTILDTDAATVSAPSWRFDLEIWQDLADEVARLEGLNENIPSVALSTTDRPASRSELEWAEAVKDRLIGIGLSEVQTYSFISKEDMERFELEPAGELANPLNPQLAFLRPSLMPSLATVIANNGLTDPILIFEVGHVFTQADESTNLGIALASSSIRTEAWLQQLTEAFGVPADKLRQIVTMKELNQTLKDSYKIRKQQAVLIEIPLGALRAIASFDATYQVPTTIAHYRPLSKFPPVTRDLAIIVGTNNSAKSIRQAILDSDDHIESVELFDEFVSSKFGEGKKSVAFHLYYSASDHTMTNDEADALHEAVQQFVQDTFGATIR